MEIKNPKVSSFNKRLTSKNKVAPEALAILRATGQENRNQAIDFADGQRERVESKEEDYRQANS